MLRNESTTVKMDICFLGEVLHSLSLRRTLILKYSDGLLPAECSKSFSTLCLGCVCLALYSPICEPLALSYEGGSPILLGLLEWNFRSTETRDLGDTASCSSRSGITAQRGDWGAEGVAQLIDYLLSMHEVLGSIPSAS